MFRKNVSKEIAELNKLKEKFFISNTSKELFHLPLEDISETMKNYYTAVKEMSHKFYVPKTKWCEEYMKNQYYELLNELNRLDYHGQPHTYILPIDNNHDSSFILDRIVQEAFERIIIHSLPKTNIENYDFANKCKTISLLIQSLCKKYNIDCELIRINPGFTQTIQLLHGSGYHYFNLVTLNGTKYIVDCSYRQFFTLRGNVIERIGTAGTVGCAIGTYMISDESRRQTASTLLNKGWIEATSENIKNYFDGFAMSFRNGLYYEESGILNFTTNYTADNYISFLNGNENQLFYEDLSFLGYQNRPLKRKLIKK